MLVSPDIKTLEDLAKFVQEHMDYAHEVRMGRKMDGDGNLIQDDDFWKGTQFAYVNIHNAINKLKESIDEGSKQ